MTDEPMASINWDFWRGETRIKGSTMCRTLREAQGVVKFMNAEHGEATHWVETQNESWTEHLEAVNSRLKENGLI